MSQAGAVKAELGEVRRRHLTRTDMQRARHQLDLTYNFGWRRINIADFLLQEMKMRADIAPAAWRNFLRHQDSTTHLGPATFALIPRGGGHEMARFDYEPAAVDLIPYRPAYIPVRKEVA